MSALTLGLPRMRKEPGERRDFLPNLVAAVQDLTGAIVERGIGSGMGFADDDYTHVGPNVRLGSNEECFSQDVVPLCAPRRIACTCSVAGRRSSRCCTSRPGHGGSRGWSSWASTRSRSTCWRTTSAIDSSSTGAMSPGTVSRQPSTCSNGSGREFASPTRPAIRVTVMGAGMIGKDAVEAATKYGNLDRAARLARLPGVEVTTVGRNLTGRDVYMKERFGLTDVLVDATQRHDPSRPIVPNAWLACLPEHAVVCDLVVDPYLLHETPPTVRGVEGIPQGDLDRWAFAPDDPAWKAVPHEVDDASALGRLVLLVAGRAPTCVHGALRPTARAAAPCPPAGRSRGALVHRGVPRAGSVAGRLRAWVEPHAAAVV